MIERSTTNQSNQFEKLPPFVEVTDFRVVREDGFKLQDEFKKKGLSILEAVSIVSYTYYLRVPVEE